MPVIGRSIVFVDFYRPNRSTQQAVCFGVSSVDRCVLDVVDARDITVLQVVDMGKFTFGQSGQTVIEKIRVYYDVIKL